MLAVTAVVAPSAPRYVKVRPWTPPISGTAAASTPDSWRISWVPTNEQVTYSFVGTQLMRQESGVDAAAVPLIGGVPGLTLTDLGARGGTTARTAQIRFGARAGSGW